MSEIERGYAIDDWIKRTPKKEVARLEKMDKAMERVVEVEENHKREEWESWYEKGGAAHEEWKNHIR